jgi:hypothetical protein
VTAAAIDIRLVALDASIVAETTISLGLPDAVVFGTRVFVFAGWEDSKALFREVRAHLIVDGEIE